MFNTRSLKHISIAVFVKHTFVICVYCKFGNFRENLIFANCVKRRNCDVKKSLQKHDLPISVNDRVVSPLYKGLFSRKFAYAKFRENKTSQKFLNLQYCRGVVLLKIKIISVSLLHNFPNYNGTFKLGTSLLHLDNMSSVSDRRISVSPRPFCLKVPSTTKSSLKIENNIFVSKAKSK